MDVSFTLKLWVLSKQRKGKQKYMAGPCIEPWIRRSRYRYPVRSHTFVSFPLWVRYPAWQHTFVSPSAFSRRAVVSYWRKYVHEVLVNRLGGLSLPRKSVVRLTDRPDMTLDVYRGRKTTMQIPFPLTQVGQLSVTGESMCT